MITWTDHLSGRSRPTLSTRGTESVTGTIRTTGFRSENLENGNILPLTPQRAVPLNLRGKKEKEKKTLSEKMETITPPLLNLLKVTLSVSQSEKS